MKWTSIKDKLPKVGDVCIIYGTLHAYREDYPRGHFKKRIECEAIYYGKKKDGKIWFGGWTTCNDGVSHYLVIPPPPKS